MAVQLSEILQSVVYRSLDEFPSMVRKIILFGSYARDSYDDESDMDIMMILDVSPDEIYQHEDNAAEIYSDISVAHEIFVSILIESEQYFHQMKDKTPFFQEIRKDGVVLFDWEDQVIEVRVPRTDIV